MAARSDMPVLLRVGHARPGAAPGTVARVGDQYVIACPCERGHVFSLQAQGLTGSRERLNLTLTHMPLLIAPGCGWQGYLAGGALRHVTEGPPRTYTLDQLKEFP